MIYTQFDVLHGKEVESRRKEEMTEMTDSKAPIFFFLIDIRSSNMNIGFDRSTFRC